MIRQKEGRKEMSKGFKRTLRFARAHLTGVVCGPARRSPAHSLPASLAETRRKTFSSHDTGLHKRPQHNTAAATAPALQVPHAHHQIYPSHTTRPLPARALTISRSFPCPLPIPPSSPAATRAIGFAQSHGPLLLQLGVVVVVV